MKECCGICKWYEHPSEYCEAPLPESVTPTYDERFMKPTDGKQCDSFKLACTDCYEDCKNAGTLYNFPKSCKLIIRKGKK